MSLLPGQFVFINNTLFYDAIYELEPESTRAAFDENIAILQDHLYNLPSFDCANYPFKMNLLTKSFKELIQLAESEQLALDQAFASG